jgi:hypothetical protein
MRSILCLLDTVLYCRKEAYGLLNIAVVSLAKGIIIIGDDKRPISSC